MKVSKCPFTPTCSNYSIDSFKKYGFIKGLPLSVWRVLRCNPFNKGYYDPPEHWAIKLKMINKPHKKKKPTKIHRTYSKWTKIQKLPFS